MVMMCLLKVSMEYCTHPMSRAVQLNRIVFQVFYFAPLSISSSELFDFFVLTRAADEGNVEVLKFLAEQGRINPCHQFAMT